MDKEQFIEFIEEAKKLDYTDEMIAKEIQDYEERLKKGIDLDPTLFLVRCSSYPRSPKYRDSDK